MKILQRSRARKSSIEEELASSRVSDVDAVEALVTCFQNCFNETTKLRVGFVCDSICKVRLHLLFKLETISLTYIHHPLAPHLRLLRNISSSPSTQPLFHPSSRQGLATKHSPVRLFSIFPITKKSSLKLQSPLFFI